ncbi:MAG: hypothetical protein ACXWCG_11275 [Flavitalea sp.]
MKSIILKSKGDLTISSLDAGGLKEKTLPFDSFIQVIDAAADLTINVMFLKPGPGECIIIPAHAANRFHAVEQFKMITTIKSGYE